MLTLTKLTTLTMPAVVFTSTAMSALATGQQSEWPAVLAKMPANTQVAFMARSFADQDRNWGQFLTAVELNAFGIPNPSDVLAALGPALEHVDRNAPVGVAMIKGHMEDEMPPFLVFLPVSNYEGLADTLSTGVENGLNIMDFGDGDTWYARQSGGYAVLGMNEGIVSNYSDADNALARFSQLAGPSAAEIARQSDVAVAVDFDGLAELVNPLLDEAATAFNEQMQMVQAMGMGANVEQAQMTMALFREAVEIIMEDGQCVVVGASTGAKGVRIDSNMSWKPDSTIGKFCMGGHEARNLLSRCDGDPYLLAISMDLKGMNIAGFLESVMTRLPEDLQNLEMLKTSPAIEKMWGMADGTAMVLYPSPAGIMGGALSGLATVYTGDGAKLRDSMRSLFTDMNGKTRNGATFATEYAENAAEIEGISVDSYSVQMQLPPELAQANQVISMMYGPGGMRGYIVPIEDGIIMTASRNKVLVRKMLTAQDGEAAGLAADDQIKAVNKMLPDNAVFRAYLGVGTLTQWVGPMVAMFLPGVDFSAMADLPPIAMAAAVESNSIRKTLVIPAPLIKGAVRIGMQMQAAQMGFGPGGDDDEEDEPPLF